MLDPNTRHALVFLRYGIGDVVMELPALWALRQALPRANLTTVGAFPAIQLLEGSGLPDERIDLRAWGLSHRWDAGTPEAIAAFRAWFVGERFELVFDVHHAPLCLARTIWELGITTLETVEEAEAMMLLEGGNGVAAVARAAFVGWGLEELPTATPHIVPLGEHVEAARGFLANRGIDDGKPFAVSPVASLDLKRWPLDQLATVVDHLTCWQPGPVLVFCGPQMEAGEELRARVRDPERLHLVGPLHLLVVAALLARCRAVVSNDTGLMHMAAAVGTPTLAIFGPTRAAIYRPPGDHVISVEPEMLSCPYRETASLHPPRCFAAGRCLVGPTGCISATPVAAVIERLRELLAITEILQPIEVSIG